MGSCMALFLAKRGFKVTVFDAESAPMQGASRWNEGKIHLGYLYSADGSLETARRILPGGLAFGRIVSSLISAPLESVTTEDDDIFLVHAASAVDPDRVGCYLQSVGDLVREQAAHGDYLCDCSRAAPRRLSARELAALSDSEAIVTGFRVPERSVRTGWIADRLGAALSSEPSVTIQTGVTVTAAAPVDSIDGLWNVQIADGTVEPFDVVVNALWHGRMAVDATAGLPPEREWSNRYRVSLFARTHGSFDVPSATIVVGPFGDMKNYDGENFYLSWYPAGLLLNSAAVAPRRPDPLDASARKFLLAAVESHLGALVPRARDVLRNAAQIEIEGGFVYAAGRGSLADPKASLHRRDRFGVRRRGRYFSIDTGKYSTAPLLAQELSKEIANAVLV